MDYDVIVLGGGSAGSSAASAASAAGARTLMINDGELGGLCILRGCMPTKTLLATAHAVHEAEQLERLGARLEGRAIPDFQRIMARKDAAVARFKKAKVDTIEASDYEVLDGRGRFVAGGGVSVNGKTLTARSYVIATGSVPAKLPISGIDDVPVLDSDGVMRLEQQPRALVVQGAGAVGLELAQFFARIGTCVTLVSRSPLLSKVDADCGAELQRALVLDRRLELLLPATIERVRPEGAGLSATILGDGATREVSADALLMAAGRTAALGGIGLEHAGVETMDCRIEHDPQMRTSNPNVFVAGDATGSYQILHLANQEARIAGHNAANGAERTMDYRLKMRVIFTDPPFAQVGLTELEAQRQGRKIIVARENFPETGRAITMGVRHGLWKVVADPQTGEILGTSILGPRADDLAHLISTLMYYRGTAANLLELPWYHPTLSEVLMGIGRRLVGKTG